MKRCRLVRRNETTLVCADCGQRVRSPEGGPAVAVICRLQDAPPPVQSGDLEDDWPRDANGNAKPSDQWESDDLPCIHRGPVIETNLSCDVCGEIGKKYTKYACALHGECSIIKRKKQGLRFCQRCPDREKPSTPRTGLIRVAVLTPDLGAGGAERWVASLVKFLPRERATATAVGVVSDGQKWDSIAREITATGTPVYGTRAVKWGIHPTAKSTVTFVANDAEVARRTMATADVVVSWGIANPGPLLDAARWRGPHIVVSHGSSDWAKRQLGSAVATGTHFVAVSSDAAKAFPPGVTPEIIWNGSELERLAPTADRDTIRASWGCSPDDLLVGFVGRLSPEKNPLAVAHLAAALQKRMPSRRVRPVWIGTGLVQVVPGLQAEAKAIAGDACVWVPPPAHIGDAWGALDLHVMASPEEGFSLVVTEALIAGVPTVATRAGIVPDLLARWGNVVVAVEIDPTGEQLADAAEVALSGDHGANVLHARQVVWEHFTAAAMGQRWADWLGEIV